MCTQRAAAGAGNAGNVRAACKLKMRPDQEDLVAPVAGPWPMPHHADTAWPRLIYDSGPNWVGFIMAAFAPEHQNPLFTSYCGG